MSAPDPAILTRCERIEQAAFASMTTAAPPAFAAAIGLATARIAGALAIASRATEKRMCNHVFGLGLESPATEAQVGAAEEHSRRAGARRCSIVAAPGPHRRALAAALGGSGFAPTGLTLRLACEPASAPVVPAPTSLGVRELAAADAAEFAAVLGDTFAFPPEFAPWFATYVGRPGWRVYGAFDAGRLVACGALHTAGGDGWLGLGATLAGWRGRGAQSAIIAARMAAAREAGIALLALETGPDTPEKPNPSTHNARRLGFADLYERPTWVKVLRED